MPDWKYKAALAKTRANDAAHEEKMQFFAKFFGRNRDRKLARYMEDHPVETERAAAAWEARNA